MNAHREQLILVIDQGTHATRAVVFDSNGALAASSNAAVDLVGHGTDTVEQDSAQIVASVRSVVQDVLSHPTVARAQIQHAGLATQRSSVVAWDRKTGEPLSPVLSWQDRRTASWIAQMADQAERIKARTGLPLSPHYGAAKLRWLMDNNAAVANAYREGRLAFGPLASYVVHALVEGAPFVVDHANASRTLLWSAATRDWDPELLGLFGVPWDALPECKPIVADYGFVRGTRIPLRAVTGDQNAAVFSLGRPPRGTATVNIGTGAFVLVPTGNRVVPHPSLLNGLIYSDTGSGLYTIEGTVNGAAAALDWAVRGWNLPDPVVNLPQWFAAATNPPLFLNSIGGLGSPFWRSGPAPRLVEADGSPLQRSIGNAERAVAVVESILFLIQANIEAMEAAGVAIERIQVGGGLARSDELCRRLADLSARTVYRGAETEATARGAAFLAAGRPARWPRPGRGRNFLPRPNAPLRERYRAFLELIAKS